MEVLDGQGNVSIFEFASNSNLGNFQSSRKETPLKDLKIATAIPKGNRLDFYLQKLTEIGTTEIYFVEFERSVRNTISESRCSRILEEACIQSRRYFLPKISFCKSWKEIPNLQDLVVFMPEGALFSKENWKPNLVPLVGPEGGFSPKELEEFSREGLEQFRLPTPILRIETAGIYLVSIGSCLG